METPLRPETPLLSTAPSDGSPGAAATFEPGMRAAETIGRLNDHALRLDAAASLAAGMPGVLRGLDISIGEGLAVRISEGVAAAAAMVSFGGGPKSVPPNAVSRIWLTPSGRLFQSVDDDPPMDGATFLGSAIAGDLDVERIDLGGRVELPGGLPVRILPSEPPTACATGTPVHVGRGEMRSYLWDGARWCLLLDLADVPALPVSPTASQIAGALRALGLVL